MASLAPWYSSLPAFHDVTTGEAELRMALAKHQLEGAAGLRGDTWIKCDYGGPGADGNLRMTLR